MGVLVSGEVRLTIKILKRIAVSEIDSGEELRAEHFEDEMQSHGV